MAKNIMHKVSQILENDIDSFSIPDELGERLRNSTMIVTGATGLIGSIFVKCVYSLGKDIRFILPVRNVDKAIRLFVREADKVSIQSSGLCEFFDKTTVRADYIVHCASPTNGRFMTDYPAETYLMAIESTKSILEYAKKTNVKGIVYLSSIEYYGQIHEEAPITEDMIGYVDHSSTRSSYSLGKQAAEYLCFCYSKEFGIPVKIARLTQTFGAGIAKEDNRVFAQFARSILKGEDIILHTEGKSAKPYCYTTDCVSAILYILLSGINGESYNVSTPGTYLTIRQLAELYKSEFNPMINIKCNLDNNNCYAPETMVNLNSGKLQSLGWKPKYDLKEMLHRLICYIKELND